MAGMMAGSGQGIVGTKTCVSTEKFERPCLHCGTPHDHSNSFCSAKCCKEYRRRKKLGKATVLNTTAKGAPAKKQPASV